MNLQCCKKLLACALVLVFAKAKAQTDSLVRFYNPVAVSAPKGYSHAAVVDLGNCRMVMLSGQVPLNARGELVGKDDFAQQTEQVWLNIKNALAELGGNMHHLVKLGVFIKDVAQLESFRAIRNRYVNTANPPASTLLVVKGLFRDDVLIEVEATAIIPKN